MIFEELPRIDWILKEENLIKVFKNNDYLVQVYNDNGFIRLSIHSTTFSLNPDGFLFWKDKMTWDILQKIKNSIGYENHWLCEIYPPKDREIKTFMRHFFLLKEESGFAFKE